MRWRTRDRKGDDMDEDAFRAEGAGFHPPDRRLLLKAEEAAKLLRLGRSTVFELLAAGELPSVKIGRSVRIPYAGLLDWVRERTGRAA